MVFWNGAERAVSETEIKTAETLNGLYTDSGNFYYRSGWEIDSNYTYLHNGRLEAPMDIRN